MFYAHFVLSKKGPLARIWLAAHWDKKLTKANIFETDIVGCIETIKSPKTKLALRTSGHLLVGVVRIYSRKAKYLLADCNEALLRIRLAFRPDTIDLPTDQREAPVDAITLCPKFCDFEAINDVSVADIESRLINNYHQGRPEDITLHEDALMSRRFMTFNDDDFGFDDLMYKKWLSGYRPDIAALVARFEQIITAGSQPSTSTSLPVASPQARCLSHKDSMADSGFGSPPFDYWGDAEDEGYDESEIVDDVLPCSSGVRRCLEWSSTLFPTSVSCSDGNDMTAAVAPELPAIGDVAMSVGGPDGGFPTGSLTIDALVHEPPPDAMLFVEPPSVTEKPALHGYISETTSEANASGGPVECGLFEEPVDEAAASRNLLFEEAAQSPAHGTSGPDQAVNGAEAMMTDDAGGAGPTTQQADDTTLIQSDANEFALEPIVVVAGDETSRAKSRRKRRLIVDETKVIASETMKRHMKHTGEITQGLELAPPRKRLMLLKEIGCTENLLALPGIPLASSRLSQLFSRSLHVSTDGGLRDASSRNESSTAAVAAGDSMLSEARRNISVDGVGRDSLASVSNDTVGAIDSSHATDVGVSLLNASSASSTTVANDSTAVKTRSRRRRLPSVSEVPAPDPDLTDEQLHVEDVQLHVEDVSAVVNGVGGTSGEEYVSSSDDQAVNSSSNAAMMEELNQGDREEQQDRWNRAQLHAVLRKALLRHTTTCFSDIAPPHKAYRKLVAAQFYAVLALKKQLVIDVDQPEPFADIIIRRGPNFSVADK